MKNMERAEENPDSLEIQTLKSLADEGIITLTLLESAGKFNFVPAQEEGDYSAHNTLLGLIEEGYVTLETLKELGVNVSPHTLIELELPPAETQVLVENGLVYERHPNADSFDALDKEPVQGYLSEEREEIALAERLAAEREEFIRDKIKAEKEREETRTDFSPEKRVLYRLVDEKKITFRMLIKLGLHPGFGTSATTAESSVDRSLDKDWAVFAYLEHAGITMQTLKERGFIMMESEMRWIPLAEEEKTFLRNFGIVYEDREQTANCGTYDTDLRGYELKPHNSPRIQAPEHGEQSDNTVSISAVEIYKKLKDQLEH